MDVRAAQDAHFAELYAGFRAYYEKTITKDDSPAKKVRLQLTTVFFDDAELQKYVLALFSKFSTNTEEKRAVARAAYWDVIMTHNRTAGLKFETVSPKQLKAEGSQYK